MRQLQEIDKDIAEINKQIFALNRKKKALTTERFERIFAGFCEEHGVKGGDIVELNNREHTQLQVVDMDYHYSGWVRCHKLKKNGEPYSNPMALPSWEFDGCKFVKSMGE